MGDCEGSWGALRRGVLRAGLFVACVVCVLLSALDASAAIPAEAERGLDRMRALGCVACHTLDGQRQVGPTFVGLFGSVRRVQTQGVVREVTIDEAYVERALLEPDADVSDGYAKGTMPRFELEQGERDDVIAALRYLKSENAQPTNGSMVSLVVSALLFVALHLVMSSRPVRDPVIRRIGSKAFQGIYSLIIIGVFSWMLYAWSRAPFVPLWSSPSWTRYVPLCAMAPILVLMVAGYSTRNPTTAGQESQLSRADSVTGILRITRHPVNVSTALWGLAHLPPNGDLASLLLFGSITSLAILGTLHIERRRRRSDPEAWERFASATSIVPFAAIARGRNRVSVREIGVWRIGLGLALFAAALLLHTRLIGASPYPF